MPLYDYRCRACSKVTEVRHGFREAHQAPCPACGGELARVFTPAGIVFKGSGFYLTDSRKANEKSKAAPAASDSSASSESAKPAETGKTADSSTAPAPAAPSAPAASSGTGSSSAKSESSAA